MINTAYFYILSYILPSYINEVIALSFSQIKSRKQNVISWCVNLLIDGYINLLKTSLMIMVGKSWKNNSSIHQNFHYSCFAKISGKYFWKSLFTKINLENLDLIFLYFVALLYLFSNYKLIFLPYKAPRTRKRETR